MRPTGPIGAESCKPGSALTWAEPLATIYVTFDWSISVSSVESRLRRSSAVGGKGQKEEGISELLIVHLDGTQGGSSVGMARTTFSDILDEDRAAARKDSLKDESKPVSMCWSVNAQDFCI